MKRSNIKKDSFTPVTKRSFIPTVDSKGTPQQQHNQEGRHPLACFNNQFQSPLPYEHKAPMRGSLGPRKSFYNLKQLGLGNLGIPKVITKQIRGEKPGELALFEPTDQQKIEGMEKHGKEYKKVLADEFLCTRLRPHQRDGLKFLFECCTGLKKDGFYGCILSDGMGLGKTFQSISLLWTLLNQGVFGEATCTKALILCPASLVSNWGKEVIKWLEGRIEPTIVDDTRADQVKAQIQMFGGVGYMKHRKEVFVMSYSTFRNYKEQLYKKQIDFLICDEAHQLKNKDSQVTQAVQGIPTKRRLLLSGTPIQNDLLEFYAMVNVANPELLGDPTTFHKYYENPILQGREPYTSDEETMLAEERSVELVDTCNQFMLRRTNQILKSYLPQKVEQVLFCRLSPLQLKLYNYQNNSTAVVQAVFKADSENQKDGGIKLSNKGQNLAPLAAITALKKLCAHPDLIYEMQVGPILNQFAKQVRRSNRDSTTHTTKNTFNAVQSQPAVKALTGFEGCGDVFYEEDNNPTYQPGECQVVHSGKVYVLQEFLKAIRQGDKTDKTVIVSNYTETLDLLEKVCKVNGWVSLRLDGSCSIKSRQTLVDQFNNPQHVSSVFLLSSKAGGTGLNIIGANRLILFDPDWNPANDQQAMARVWREGQRKDVWIYRFLGTGTLEEKIYQRQIAKEGLSQAVVDDQKGNRHFSRDDLKQLFKLDQGTACDTHKQLRCKCKNPETKNIIDHQQQPPDGSSFQPQSFVQDNVKSDNNIVELCSDHDNIDTDKSKSGNQQQQENQENNESAKQNTDKGILKWAHLDSHLLSPDQAWLRCQDQMVKNLVSFIFSDHNLQEERQELPKIETASTNNSKINNTNSNNSNILKPNISYVQSYVKCTPQEIEDDDVASENYSEYEDNDSDYKENDDDNF